MNWRDYIERTPGIMFGKPVFKGTRMKVELVLERLSSGDSPEELLREYPQLRPEHLRAAYGYAAALVSGVSDLVASVA